jgi:hypothetical protein
MPVLNSFEGKLAKAKPNLLASWDILETAPSYKKLTLIEAAHNF